MAPRMPSSPVARRNSFNEAVGSLRGSVASAVNRPPRVSIASLNSSFTIDASRAAAAGVSTCVPGVVKVTTCIVTPFDASTSSRYARSR
jgi:hypothetical protein